MTTGVIVGRFQTPYLTQGHKFLLNSVTRDFDRVVVIIGDSPSNFNDKHPLPYEVRAALIQYSYPNVETYSLGDHKSDEVWSERLDAYIRLYAEEGEVAICGSRDCFADYYHGKYPVKVYDSICEHVSATELRKTISIPKDVSVDFNSGMIYAQEKRFPVVYPTVDIAVVGWDADTTKDVLVLGRKPGSTKWQFPGGFVDPTDESLEAAALREVGEEISGLKDLYDLTFIGSRKINDWRYKGTKDGIMTSFFVVFADPHGELKASDDLEEVKVFTIPEAQEVIADEHRPLLDILIKYLSTIL